GVDRAAHGPLAGLLAVVDAKPIVVLGVRRHVACLVAAGIRRDRAAIVGGASAARRERGECGERGDSMTEGLHEACNAPPSRSRYRDTRRRTGDTTATVSRRDLRGR